MTGDQGSVLSARRAAPDDSRTTSNDQRTTNPRARRWTLIGAGVALGVIVVAVVLATRGGSSTASSSDSQLRQAASQAVRLLDGRQGRLPVTDTTLRSFQAWVYNEEAAFATLSQAHQPAGQFVQLLFDDPNTMPPQVLGLNAPGHSFVSLDPAITSHVAQSGQSQFTDTQINGKSMHVYLSPLTPPHALSGTGIYGLVEVVRES